MTIASLLDGRMQWDERRAAMIALRKMPTSRCDDDAAERLIKIFKRETHPYVRKELAATFGDLKWNHEGIINLLIDIFENELDANIRRRAALSLGKIKKPEEILRKRGTPVLSGENELTN